MMPVNVDWSQYRSILCLNGSLPEKSFFSNMKLPVIAADGAANTLYDLGITPLIIIGDLDGVRDDIRKNNKIHYCPDQDSSDFNKSLEYLKENQLLPAIVVGVNGGYIDHILNNINIFLGTDCLLYDPPVLGCVLNEETKKELVLPIDTKISLIGMPHARISSNGLKWDLKNAELRFPGANSCFNRVANELAQIEVHQGTVLVLIYSETIQDKGVL